MKQASCAPQKSMEHLYFCEFNNKKVEYVSVSGILIGKSGLRKNGVLARRSHAAPHEANTGMGSTQLP
tara:strand:+ start:24 stop:227 length:204 start_codon:yes stop_codon:yes gene_type:complete